MDVGQKHGHALIGGECCQAALDHAYRLGVQRPLFWGAPGGGAHDPLATVRHQHVQGVGGTSLALAQFVTALIARDAENPGLKGSTAISAQPTPGGDEGLLTGVFRCT